MPVPRIVVVSGDPGAGKSRLARGLAERLGSVLLDLDDLAGAPTEALLASIGQPPEAIDDPALAAALRSARYDSLVAAAKTNLEVGNRVVLAAPFTAERRDLGAWSRLVGRLAVSLPGGPLGAAAVGASPSDPAGRDVVLVFVDCPPGERARRLAVRGLERDRAKRERRLPEASERPVVPHLRVDATQACPEVLEGLLGRLGRLGGNAPGESMGHQSEREPGPVARC